MKKVNFIIKNLKQRITSLMQQLKHRKYVIPQHMSLSEWNKYKKKHPDVKGPKDYEDKHPGTKWKIVHGNKKGSIGKPLKGMTNLSYQEAIKAHAAIMISKGGG